MKTECVWEAYHQWPIKDQFVFKKTTQNENTCLVSIDNVTKGLFQYCQPKKISTRSQCPDSYNSLFPYFYNSLVDLALQEEFCFCDFQVFQLSWLRSKIWKKCTDFCRILQAQNSLKSKTRYPSWSFRRISEPSFNSLHINSWFWTLEMLFLHRC